MEEHALVSENASAEPQGDHRPPLVLIYPPLYPQLQDGDAELRGTPSISQECSRLASTLQALLCRHTACSASPLAQQTSGRPPPCSTHLWAPSLGAHHASSS